MSYFYFNSFPLPFVAANPVGSAPMFAVLGADGDRSQQRRTAIGGVTLAVPVLLAASFSLVFAARVLAVSVARARPWSAGCWSRRWPLLPCRSCWMA